MQANRAGVRSWQYEVDPGWKQLQTGSISAEAPDGKYDGLER